MSAFYLDHAHIDALVTAAFQANRSSMWSQAYYGNLSDETAMGKLLLAENARSLTARYGDNPNQFAPDIESYRHTLRMKDVNRSPVEVIKICSCYHYQACETDDYKQTRAAKIIDRIRDEAISRLPGYERAPWCIHNTDVSSESECVRLI